MLINTDDSYSVQAGGVGGDNRLGGVEGDGVDGVPRQSQLTGHRGHGGALDHQPAQDIARTPARGRPARPRQCRGVVGEHFPLTGTIDTPVTGHPHPQSQPMPDHRHIGHSPDHGVAVNTIGAAPRTLPLAVIEQSAEHHRGIAVDGGVGDRHPELDGAHDRVGNNSSRQTT